MDGDDSRPPDGQSSQWHYKSDNADDDEVSKRDKIPPEYDSGEQDEQSTMLHPDEYAPDSTDQQLPQSDPDDSVSWSASEFIAHHKSASWYGVLGLATLVVAALVFLITRDKISTVVIIFVGIIFGISASRQPRTLGYRVDAAGLTIGPKLYAYEQFRAFAVMREDAFSSVVFMPLKRFTPLLTIYYDPKDEQHIIRILSDRLPLDTHKLDWIDQLMRRVRF